MIKIVSQVEFLDEAILILKTTFFQNVISSKQQEFIGCCITSLTIIPYGTEHTNLGPVETIPSEN